MESKWRPVTLGEFVRLRRGHDLPHGARKPGSVPVMGSGGQNGFHDQALAKGPGVVIGRSGMGSMGVVSYCSSDYWPHNTVLYVTDFLGNDVRFVYYFLSQLNLRRFNSGSAQASLNRNYIYPIPIVVPPLNEQCAIGHILGTLDDKIELNHRRNQTLEAMARALFKDWFVNFGPVRAKMEGREPYLPADIWQLFPDRLDDEGKPEGWELIPLNGLASLETSSISPSKSPEAVFEHYSIPAFDAGGMPAMELGDSIKSNKYKVHADAVLVSKLNPQTPRIWLPTVATDHAVCSTEFMQFVPRTRDDRPFLYCLMVSEVMQAEVLRHVTGSTGSRQRAQPSQIAKVEVLLPEPNILSAFNRKAEPLLRAIADNQLESQTLTQLRDTLLPKLISGELRIKNADKFLERVA